MYETLVEEHSEFMWCAAKSFTIAKFNYFMGLIEEKVPKALEWLDENRSYVAVEANSVKTVK